MTFYDVVDVTKSYVLMILFEHGLFPAPLLVSLSLLFPALTNRFLGYRPLILRPKACAIILVSKGNEIVNRLQPQADGFPTKLCVIAFDQESIGALPMGMRTCKRGRSVRVQSAVNEQSLESIQRPCILQPLRILN